MGQRQKKIGKIIAWSVSVIVFLFVVEITARVDDALKYGAPILGRYSNERLRARDENGMRYNIPNAHFEKWQNNKFGFRGPDFDPEKPEGLTRIVCMGVSETYGLFEDEGKDWPGQLSEMLEPYQSFHVINAATVGLSLPDYTNYMEKYVFKFDPDIIIILANPQSFMGAMAREERENPTSANPTAGKAGTNNSLLANLVAGIRILPKAKQMLIRFVPAWLLEKFQYWDRTRKIEQLENNLLKGRKTIDVIPVEYQDAFRKEIEKIVQAVRERGIKVILSTYPILMTEDNIDDYPLIIMESRRFCVHLSYDGMLDASRAADSIVQVIASEYGLGFVDGRQIVPNSTEYFGDNVHLTNAGAEIFAGALADYIVTHYGKKEIQ